MGQAAAGMAQVVGGRESACARASLGYTFLAYMGEKGICTERLSDLDGVGGAGTGAEAGAGTGGGRGLGKSWRSWSHSPQTKKWMMGSGHKCISQAGNECGHKSLKFANMGLRNQRLRNPSILANY